MSSSCLSVLLSVMLSISADVFAQNSGFSGEDASLVLTLSGSGTTNPSKLLWRVFSNVEDQAGSPIRVTYRAVGSSSGIKEFVGNPASGYEPFSDFASADIPIPAADYGELSRRNIKVLQIPFVLGAVSFFHTVKAGSGALSHSIRPRSHLSSI